MAKNSAVGLDIGSKGIQVAHITMKGGSASLVNFGGVELPDGAVREGEILDVAAVSAAVKQLVSDTKIKDKKVYLGVANQRVVVRQIDIPYLPEDELRASLRFQVQEYIPIPVEDAELDFHKLDEYAGDGDARMLRLLLVAAHKDMVSSHISAVQEAGLKPVGVDLNSFAVMRALTSDNAVSDGSELVVDIGAGVTNIVVHENGVPRFVRILVMGGGEITAELVRDLNISQADAEQLKFATGLQPGSTDAGAKIIEKGAGTFIEEVRSSLDYYQAQTGSSRVTRVLISGGGSKLPGLLDRLAGALRLPVEYGRPLGPLNVKSNFGPEQLGAIEPMLATAVGLAMGGLE